MKMVSSGNAYFYHQLCRCVSIAGGVTTNLLFMNNGIGHSASMNQRIDRRIAHWLQEVVLLFCARSIHALTHSPWGCVFGLQLENSFYAHKRNLRMQNDEQHYKWDVIKCIYVVVIYEAFPHSNHASGCTERVEWQVHTGKRQIKKCQKIAHTIIRLPCTSNRTIQQNQVDSRSNLEVNSKFHQWHRTSLIWFFYTIKLITNHIISCPLVSFWKFPAQHF